MQKERKELKGFKLMLYRALNTGKVLLFLAVALILLLVAGLILDLPVLLNKK